MSVVNLRAQDLTDTAAKIEAAADRIDRALQNLDVVMSDLDSVWSDANARKYLQRYNELKEEFPEFKASIRSYGTFLNSVVAAYDKHFNQNVAARVNTAE